MRPIRPMMRWRRNHSGRSSCKVTDPPSEAPTQRSERMDNKKKRSFFAVLVLLILSVVTVANWRSGELRATNERRNAAHESPANPEEILVYVGTYTGPRSVGIYRYRLDLTTGGLLSA